MRWRVVLRCRELRAVSLRSVGWDDRNDLREWKNSNRRFFFHQEVITDSRQRLWFEDYLTRADDAMFIVHWAEEKVGCMGYRLCGGEVDLYNIIRGRPDLGGRGLMSHALRIMCSHAQSRYGLPICAKIRRTNPATTWYLRNSFRIIAVEDEFIKAELDQRKFRPCEVIELDTEEVVW